MSSYRIYAGNKKALVFPIMGDGYVHLDYSKHIPKGQDGTQSNAGLGVQEFDDDDDAKYGLWGHKSSFTMEAVITPYDINGFGYELGANYEGAGTPNLSPTLNQMELPLKKYHSPLGRYVGTNSRTASYFSHTIVAHLAVAVNNSATTLTLSNLENISGGTNIRIGNEEMEVTTVDTGIGTGKTVTVVRGRNGTTATSHLVKAPVYGDNRINHKMTIFYNDTCEFYLKNMTRTTMNQPAEYKIGCRLKGKDTHGNMRTVTVESLAPVITADEEYYGKTVEQTYTANTVFGKPVYLSQIDRVRYHKKVDTNGHQIYVEKLFTPFDPTTGFNNVHFGQESIMSTGDGNFINLVDQGQSNVTWPSGMVAGTQIKIIGTNNNDGYYRIKIRHNNYKIELDTNSTGSVLTGEIVNYGGVCMVNYAKNLGEFCFGNGDTTYYTRNTSNANTNNIDMTPHLWQGANLYAQLTNDDGYFNSQMTQKLPTYLGWIKTLNCPSSNKTDIVKVAKCKVVRPIRNIAQTYIYVDDVRYLKFGDVITINGETMTIRTIENNGKIGVVRGGTPQTTSLNAFNLTNATNSNYIIDPLEEYNFSRTVFGNLDEDLLYNLRVQDSTTGSSLSNSDTYGYHLLGDTFKEASYLLRPFHIAFSYDATAQRIDLFLDGKALETQTFDEGNLRLLDLTIDGPNVHLTTVDKNGFTGEGEDFIKIENSNVNHLDGVWQVESLVPDSPNTFHIQTTNTPSGTLSSDVIATDVSDSNFVKIKDFEFGPSDCFLGSNGDTTLATRRSSQFMGEMHEFAITKEYKDKFNSMDTLVPNIRNTLLYFRFEGDES